MDRIRIQGFDDLKLTYYYCNWHGQVKHKVGVGHSYVIVEKDDSPIATAPSYFGCDDRMLLVVVVV